MDKVGIFGWNGPGRHNQTSYEHVEGLDMDLCDHYPSSVGTCILVIYELSLQGLILKTKYHKDTCYDEIEQCT